MGQGGEVLRGQGGVREPVTEAHRSIDIHTHIMAPGWEDFGARVGIDDWPSVRRHDTCNATIMLGSREFRRVTDQCFVPERRIVDMDQERIGRQLLSPIPITLCYWGPAETTDAFARMQNDFIAAAVAKHPQRFIGAGTVAMQSPRLAIAELERLKKMGFPAIEIGTNVNGCDLDSPDLFDIFAAAQEFDLAIFVHPLEPSIGEERMRDFRLPFIVGYPADTALAIARLILGGVLERLPRLRLCFAHGGGYFPASLGRLGRGHAMSPALRKHAPRAPAEYAKRLYFDCLTHDPHSLEFNIEKFGSNHIMIGSDYPFDMGVDHPLEQLQGVKLSEEDFENVTHRSAEAFLGMPRGR